MPCYVVSKQSEVVKIKHLKAFKTSLLSSLFAMNMCINVSWYAWHGTDRKGGSTLGNV